MLGLVFAALSKCLLCTLTMLKQKRMSLFTKSQSSDMSHNTEHTQAHEVNRGEVNGQRNAEIRTRAIHAHKYRQEK